MITEDGVAAGRRSALKGTGIRPRLRVVTDEAKTQTRRQNVLATDIEAIYKQYRHRVFLWCLRIARNVEDAEDLTQDAFLFYAARSIPIEGNQPSPPGCIAWPRILP